MRARRVVFAVTTVAWAALLGAGAGACGRHVDAAELRSPVVQGTPSAPGSGSVAAEFISHPEHIQPGLPQQRPYAILVNPYEGNRQRIADGAALFVAYNCADCHGDGGSGAMGPSLADARWHFGGSAGEVFQSIYEGRPDGMPAWGGKIADDQIWRLVAYVRSLSGGRDVSTENFTGRTVERTGH